MLDGLVSLDAMTSLVPHEVLDEAIAVSSIRALFIDTAITTRGRQ